MHVTNEKRDKRDRHIKGWRARLGFLKLLTDAERPNLAQTRKTPINDSICCISTALATPILCHIASFPSTATAYSTQTVCAKLVRQSPCHNSAAQFSSATLKGHQHPVVTFMLPAKGEPRIETSGLWDDPGFTACPPAAWPFHRAVVGSAQALLSRRWHRGGPVAKADLVRGRRR